MACSRRGEYRSALLDVVPVEPARRRSSLAAMKVSELTTPALVVEAAALDANLRTMAEAPPG